MEPTELLELLLALARDAGLEVRTLGRGRGGDLDAHAVSGTCRVRGAVWVVISASDPLELRLDVLARALRTHASALVENRYLPPAVRERITGARSRPPGEKSRLALRKADAGDHR